MLTPLFILGLLIFFAGVLLFFFSLYGRDVTPSSGGAVILIGPFPIALGSRAGGLLTILILASILLAMVMAFMVLMVR